MKIILIEITSVFMSKVKKVKLNYLAIAGSLASCLMSDVRKDHDTELYLD
jgi:hypothetical protein